MENTWISILGCGWLGLPLADYLISEGYIVKGSTTTPSKLNTLRELDIVPYIINLGNEDFVVPNDFFKDMTILIINIPPKRKDHEEGKYIKKIKQILPFIKENHHVIFVSSTSVYPNNNEIVTENGVYEPSKESGKTLLKVENLLIDHCKTRITILRLGGLVGEGRNPGRFLAGKRNLENGDAFINLIHQRDVIGLIEMIINLGAWGTIINGVADKHPTREEFYTVASEKLGLEKPHFKKSSKTSYKIVSNEKSKDILGYNYEYPDPLDWIRNN